MTAELNHTIIWCSDKHRSSTFLTEILGLPEAQAFMHFMVVALDNRVSLDFMEKSGKIASQHYAFLIPEAEFDRVFSRVKAKGLTHWADPSRNQPDALYQLNGGRGCYFEDPDGHLLEIMTRPYVGD